MKKRERELKMKNKLESTAKEIRELENTFTSEGRKPTKAEKKKIKTLKKRLENLEEVKKVWLRNPEKGNR